MQSLWKCGQVYTKRCSFPYEFDQLFNKLSDNSVIYYKESPWEDSSTPINETTDVQYNTTDVRETMEEQNTSETNLSFERTREIVHNETTFIYTDNPS